MPSLDELVARGAGHRRCNLCGAAVRFRSITNSLGATFTKYGFGYDLDDFETLNHREYGCPDCGAADRDRLYKLYLDRFLRRRPEPVRVLEFAPSAALSAYLGSHEKISVHRTADLMMPGVDDVVDITDMHQYADGSFDFFICSHVLEHVDDDRRALAELHRVLSPGGQGIVMTPVSPAGSYDEDITVTDVPERWRRFAQDDHVRLYDRATLVSRIRGAGFGVRTLGPLRLGPRAFWRHGITFGSRLYVATRTV